MKKLIFLILLLLCGCWDSRQLGDLQLGVLAAYDIENNVYKNSVLIPNVLRSGASTNEPAPASIYSSTGVTPSEASDNLDNKIKGVYSSSQLDAVLFNDELAKQGLYPYLDAFYRDPRSNLNAMIGIVKGSAAELVNVAPKSELEKVEYVEGILESLVRTTKIEDMSIAKINTYIYEEGGDFSVPILKIVDNKDEVSFDGLAIFSEGKYTEVDMPQRLSTLFLLMRGIKGDTASITTKINENEDIIAKNYITLRIQDVNTSIEVKPIKGNIRADIYMDLTVSVDEYPNKRMGNTSKIEQQIEKSLTQSANEIFKLTKKANGDLFEIGRRLHSFHNSEWKNLNWNEVYSKSNINSHINIKIRSKGV